MRLERLPAPAPPAGAPPPRRHAVRRHASTPPRRHAATPPNRKLCFRVSRKCGQNAKKYPHRMHRGTPRVPQKLPLQKCDLENTTPAVMRRGAPCAHRPPFPPAEIGHAFPPPVSLSSRIVFWHPRDYGFSAPHAASVKLHFSFNSFWGGMLEGLRVEDNRFCLFGSFREHIYIFSMRSFQEDCPHPPPTLRAPRNPPSRIAVPAAPISNINDDNTNRNNNVLV